jgi:hypothetical protein
MSPTKDSYISLLKEIMRRNIVLILILAAAALVWIWVFSTAASEFISAGERPFRSSWNGVGHFDLFGSIVYFDFEGYVDYDYYYYTWGAQFLRGIAPYSMIFDTSTTGLVSYNTPYFFPPLYVYLCSIGLLLPIDPFGIGFLISLFGYLTAFPIYGISAYLSNNRRIAEISVFTYLFNPVVLYYTVFKWLNPAPFVFFMMLSFYLLMKDHRMSGTLAMVTAALFKQVAFFLILPLIAILIKKHTAKESVPSPNEKRLIGGELDLKGFGKMVGIAVIYVVAVSLPYLFNLSNYLFYIFVKPGGILLADLTTLPDVSQPMSPAVFLIFLGAPIELVDIVNKATYYGIFLAIFLILFLSLMLLEERLDNNPIKYWRRMIFLTLLLMLCIHLFSPRGVYKYYFVALIPFFSIQSVSSMISSKNPSPKASIFMIINPIVLGFLIIFPNRYVYIAIVALILLGYLLHRTFSFVYNYLVNFEFITLFKHFRASSKEKELELPRSNESNIILKS